MKVRKFARGLVAMLETLRQEARRVGWRKVLEDFVVVAAIFLAVGFVIQAYNLTRWSTYAHVERSIACNVFARQCPGMADAHRTTDDAVNTLYEMACADYTFSPDPTTPYQACWHGVATNGNRVDEVCGQYFRPHAVGTDWAPLVACIHGYSGQHGVVRVVVTEPATLERFVLAHPELGPPGYQCVDEVSPQRRGHAMGSGLYPLTQSTEELYPGDAVVSC